MSARNRLSVVAAGVVALSIGSAAARAAEAPQTSSSSQTLRDFALRNETDRTIVEAHAFTNAGKDIEITKAGQIRARLSQNFSVHHSECLDRVQVKFDDGRTMSRDKLNDCSDPRLVARADGITVETSAGGPLH